MRSSLLPYTFKLRKQYKPPKKEADAESSEKPSKVRNMFHHTMELSSPLVTETFGAFCLCNFIVALLLLLNFGRGTAAARVDGEPKEAACNVDDDEETEKHEKEAMVRDEIEVIISENKKEARVEEEEEEDDEQLRRRADEFIQRMVNAWKEEKQVQRYQFVINSA